MTAIRDSEYFRRPSEQHLLRPRSRWGGLELFFLLTANGFIFIHGVFSLRFLFRLRQAVFRVSRSQRTEFDFQFGSVTSAVAPCVPPLVRSLTEFHFQFDLLTGAVAPGEPPLVQFVSCSCLCRAPVIHPGARNFSLLQSCARPWSSLCRAAVCRAAVGVFVRLRATTCPSRVPHKTCSVVPTMCSGSVVSN